MLCRSTMLKCSVLPIVGGVPVAARVQFQPRWVRKGVESDIASWCSIWPRETTLSMRRVRNTTVRQMTVFGFGTA
ncbi:hypothetical protein F5B19DRAFT_122689 [Rostrohypoxylon terebratum]|nr:hypothetical protein F5B19DRAFT_122689 [Rostrohypoxylon terebratum]